MKTPNFIVILMLTASTLFGQSVLTNPNNAINGLREGLWSEFNFSQIIDSVGKYHLEYGPHLVPKNVIAEGVYVKGRREGFWKEFWIVICNDSTSLFCKGGVKSIIEYKNGVPCGVVIEYHKNGFVRAIGQYETYPVNETHKLEIPDWRDPKGEKIKDTIIYVTSKNRPIGKWLFFKPDGSVWK